MFPALGRTSVSGVQISHIVVRRTRPQLCKHIPAYRYESV